MLLSILSSLYPYFTPSTLETKSNSDYDAVFEVKSVGNDNVSADIILKVKGNSESNSDSSLNGNLLLKIKLEFA